MLVIRDPDYENKFASTAKSRRSTSTLNGHSTAGKGFRALSDEEQREWIESTIAKVAHLPVDGNVRKAVEELVEEIAS